MKDVAFAYIAHYLTAYKEFFAIPPPHQQQILHLVTSSAIPSCASAFQGILGGPGATYTYIIPANCPGQYDYYCLFHVGMTGTLNVTCGTDVEENEVKPFTVYSNPSAGEFKIQLNNRTVSERINIFNTAGAEVFSTEIIASGQTITPHLPSGIYFLRLSENENQFTQKIIIE